MKRMVYILISIAGVVLAIIISTGCNHILDNNEKQLCGVSLSQNHMEYNRCFSFFLRQEDGKVLFDAQMHIDEEPYSIIIEGLEVDFECFEQLEALDKEQGITENVMNYKSKPTLGTPADKTVVTTTVYFADNTDKSAKSSVYDEQLYQFFSSLAMKYKGQSVVVVSAE